MCMFECANGGEKRESLFGGVRVFLLCARARKRPANDRSACVAGEKREREGEKPSRPLGGLFREEASLSDEFHREQGHGVREEERDNDSHPHQD